MRPGRRKARSLPSEFTSDGIVGSALSVAYHGSPVFTDVDVAVRPGSMTGVIGPSGCGKTSLLRAIAGLTPLAAGRLDYDGRDRPPIGSVALLAQHPRQVCNPRWTVGRVIAEPARIRRSVSPPDVGAVADRVGLARDLLERFPAQVSDGQLQRACLARMLVQSPRYILCDEPTAMLDPIAAHAVIDILSGLVDEGTGVLLVSHHQELVRRRCPEVLEFGPTI